MLGRDISSAPLANGRFSQDWSFVIGMQKGGSWSGAARKPGTEACFVCISKRPDSGPSGDIDALMKAVVD